jgi:hypothetical protein
MENRAKRLILASSVTPKPADWFERETGKTWWTGPGVGVSTYHDFRPGLRMLTINPPQAHRPDLDSAVSFLRDLLEHAKRADVIQLRFNMGWGLWTEALRELAKEGFLEITSMSGPVISANFL